MITAAVVPVGFVDGYRSTLRLCLERVCAEFDAVYLPLTTRQDAGWFGWLPDNAHLISDRRTWFPEIGGVPYYVPQMVATASDVGWHAARHGGADQIVYLFCNCYVTPDCAAYLRQPVDGLGYVHRCDSLSGVVFHADKMWPYVLRADSDVQFGLDGITYNGKPAPWIAGCWPEMDGVAVIDLPLELPLSDYAARMNFIRCYHDLVPKRRPEFVWSDWKKYFTDKYSRKHRSDRPLPFDLDTSGFVSRQVLAELEGE